MSIFSKTSRYRFATLYQTTDRTGRAVLALTPPTPPTQRVLGEHLRADGERLDHLARFYLDDATAFWRLALIGDALTPDTLAQATSLVIPAKR